MKKVNFLLEDEVEAALRKFAPPRKMSQIVNEALRKELLRRKRITAYQNLLQLRKNSARFSSQEILEILRKDRRSH